MRTLHLFRTRFRPNLMGTLLTLVLVTFLMSLGFWQLHRAEEKKELLRLAKAQTLVPPSPWQVGMALPKLFQGLVLQGHYLSYTLLLDNQYSEAHQWGYHVLNALLVAKGHVVLVDRGWVLGDLRRSVLPAIEIPSGAVLIQGQAYYPSSKGLVLGDVIEPHGTNLAVIERVDIKLVSNLLHKKVSPFIIRLDKRAAGGYARDWPIVSMPPERHYAYALQWFAMAFILVLIYLIFPLI